MRVLVLLLFSLTAGAQEGVNIVPRAPTDRTPVYLRNSFSCPPGPATVQVLGSVVSPESVIRVRYEYLSGNCGDPAIPLPYTLRVPGLLEAGEYRVELIDEYKDQFANPYTAAERGYVDDVIRPSETRRVLCDVLAVSRTKRVERPKRRHGNIPL